MTLALQCAGDCMAESSFIALVALEPKDNLCQCISHSAWRLGLLTFRETGGTSSRLYRITLLRFSRRTR